MGKIINLEIHLDLTVSDKYFKDWNLIGKDRHFISYTNGEVYGNMEVFDRVANQIFRNNNRRIFNIICRDTHKTWEDVEDEVSS